jgi:hypothetical protein
MYQSIAFYLSSTHEQHQPFGTLQAVPPLTILTPYFSILWIESSLESDISEYSCFPAPRWTDTINKESLGRSESHSRCTASEHTFPNVERYISQDKRLILTHFRRPDSNHSKLNHLTLFSLYIPERGRLVDGLKTTTLKKKKRFLANFSTNHFGQIAKHPSFQHSSSSLIWNRVNFQ